MALAGLLRAVPRGPGHLWSSLVLRTYAKEVAPKGKGRGSLKEAFRGLEVCKDAALLTTHSMGTNIYKEGPEVALKPDSEYPEWLFLMDIGPSKKLEDLDPNTMAYWRFLRKVNTNRRYRLRKFHPF